MRSRGEVNHGDFEHPHDLVRIPPHVVEDAARSAPPTLVLHGRDRARDVVVERDQFFAALGGPAG
ncbi:MAG: hypothetical protein WCJ30_27595, partial [Deltaproteobacteria bacterium]